MEDKEKDGGKRQGEFLKRRATSKTLRAQEGMFAGNLPCFISEKLLKNHPEGLFQKTLQKAGASLSLTQSWRNRPRESTK